MSRLPSIRHRLDAFIPGWMEVSNAPGMAIAWTDHEHTQEVLTYGFFDLAAKTRITRQTLFEIGSIGKSFTSIALLQEHEAGRLDLHAPVTEYLPWFQVQSPYPPITVHHLLSHTAGLVRGADFSPDSRAEVWALRQTEAGWAPGERYFYSNDGYKALGLVLTAIAGQSYADIMRERILRPLGMDATEPVITHEVRKRLAIGYTTFYDDRPTPGRTPPVPSTWLETDTADGCIASTAGDMASYVRALLNRGRGPSEAVLSTESFELLTRRVIETSPGSGRWYGYGLAIREEDGHTIVGHGGGMPGFVSHIGADLDAGVGAVVLINGQADALSVSDFVRRLLRAAVEHVELPNAPVLPDPAIAERAVEYAGEYRGKGTSFTLRAEGGRLLMEWKGALVALEQRKLDEFYVPHPDFALFLLRFGREEGEVVEALYGPYWYVNDRYTGPTDFDAPPEWSAYLGHYRSFSPWISNFRVFIRRSMLLIDFPQFGFEVPLEPTGQDRFSLGSEPGHVSFGPIVDGDAIAANLTGADYYRVNTP